MSTELSNMGALLVPTIPNWASQCSAQPVLYCFFFGGFKLSSADTRLIDLIDPRRANKDTLHCASWVFNSFGDF